MTVRGTTSAWTRLAGAWRLAPRAYREAAWLVVIQHVALIGLGLLVWAQFQVPGPCHFELARNGWTTTPPLNDSGIAAPLVGIWQRWDACWYSKIATFGYEPGTDSSAFFPLFPVLMRAIALPLGGNVALGGMVVNVIASFFALVGIHRLVAADFGPRVAERTMLYVAIFPAAFFLVAPFTEALFLACVVWTLVYARERDWVASGALAFLAALTRLQGLLLVAPIAWEAVLAWRDGAAPPRLGALRGRVVRISPWLAAALPIMALGAFVAYTSATIGSSPFEAQDAWGGRNIQWPVTVVAASWDWVVNGPTDRGIQLVNLAGLLLFSGLALLGLRRLPFTYSLYAIPPLLLIATRSQPIPLTSTTRYLLVIFPVFVLLAIWGRERRFNMAWSLVSSILLGLLVTQFVRGDFIA